MVSGMCLRARAIDVPPPYQLKMRAVSINRVPPGDRLAESTHSKVCHYEGNNSCS
jgi:hypothetical protein